MQEIGKSVKQKEPTNKKPNVRKKHHFAYYVFLVTVGVVLCSAVMIAVLFTTSNANLFASVPEVELPVFTSMTRQEVETNPEYKNFHFNFESVYSDEFEEGVIVDQTPKAPKSVKEDATITLKVSQGPEIVTVPDVVGWKRDTAREKFKELGLSVLIKTEPSDDMVPDKVMRTTPSHGATMEAGETVTLYVSRLANDDSVRVPDCVGRSLKDAQTLLQNALLNPQTVKVPSTLPEGTVVSQSIKGGLMVSRASTVMLQVASGSASGANVVGGEPAKIGQQLYPGGPIVGNEDGQVVPGSVTGHIHSWVDPEGDGVQICATCGETRKVS